MNKLKKGSDVGHYKTDTIECIDSQRASLSHEEFRGHCKGNIQKYIWRYPEKHGENDLKELYKTRDYLDFLIQHEEERIANQSTPKPSIVAESFKTTRALTDDEMRFLHSAMAEGDET